MNKTLLTLTLFISLSFAARAQFEKGQDLLGGQLAFNSTNYENQPYSSSYTKTNSGNYNVSIGKAMKANTVLGVDFSFSSYSANNYFSYAQVPLNYKTNSFGVGVFYRIYKSLGKDFYLFGQAGLNFAVSSASGKDSTGFELLSGSGTSSTLYFMPGISYKISNHFLLELTIPNLLFINYNSNTTNVQNLTPIKMNQFNISTSLNSNPLTALGIGFRVIL
jgi:hypothetical protein